MAFSLYGFLQLSVVLSQCLPLILGIVKLVLLLPFDFISWPFSILSDGFDFYKNASKMSLYIFTSFSQSTEVSKNIHLYENKCSGHIYDFKLDHMITIFIGQKIDIGNFLFFSGILFAFSTTLQKIHLLLYKLRNDLPLDFPIHFNEKILFSTKLIYFGITFSSSSHVGNFHYHKHGTNSAKEDSFLEFFFSKILESQISLVDSFVFFFFFSVQFIHSCLQCQSQK